MSIKIKALPRVKNFGDSESGIKRVCQAYEKYLPDYGIEFTESDSYDLLVTHAGMGNGTSDVAHLHGLYWTADYADSSAWEFDANKRIVNEIRHAKQVTVPSQWVAETFQRDLRYTPHIIGHGIEWLEWQHSYPNEKYILWNKNRIGDVCDPRPLTRLATQFPKVDFVTTFGDKKPNVYVQNGIVPHEQMKQLIQRAGVYLSTTKETFGIGVLEAMASGVPVLGWAFGGNLELVQHGVNGYLAKPDNFEDLFAGLSYCLKYRKMLGDNGREMAKEWTWPKAVEKVAGVYRLATERESASVSVVIPVYNKPIEVVKRAIDSCLNQTCKPESIIIVDDGSTEIDKDGLYALRVGYEDIVNVFTKENGGVATARNEGITYSDSKYICCLDADDWIEPTFLETCVKALEDDRSLGIAYTYLKWHRSSDGYIGLGGFDDEGVGSPWPHECDYDRQLRPRNKGNLKGLNQVPTCCVFRREMWQRLGGFRQRYAPHGVGAEDAEFWTRAFGYGWKAKLITNEPLFNYSTGGQTSERKYREVDWLAWHPWAKDSKHPFASYATPKKFSHPVRQYDEPEISVIIPVGPGHEKEIINALDSLEAQIFRKWEAIVIDDTWGDDITDNFPRGITDLYNLLKSYPYVKYCLSGEPEDYSGKLDDSVLSESLGFHKIIRVGGDKLGSKGAGFARNRGAEIARAPFLLFLDADDTLHPDCLQELYTAWKQQHSIIYSNYVGQAFIEPELAKKYQDKGTLQSYNEDTKEAIISGNLPDFNCELAIQQPTDPPYLWCNITALIPKAWHVELGGFDESMETREDIDYWWRMARAGRDFYKVERELLRYRYYTGNRRHIASQDSLEGRQTAHSVLEYLRKKYEDIPPVGR